MMDVFYLRDGQVVILGSFLFGGFGYGKAGWRFFGSGKGRDDGRFWVYDWISVVAVWVMVTGVWQLVNRFVNRSGWIPWVEIDSTNIS